MLNKRRKIICMLSLIALINVGCGKNKADKVEQDMVDDINSVYKAYEQQIGRKEKIKKLESIVLNEQDITELMDKYISMFDGYEINVTPDNKTIIFESYLKEVLGEKINEYIIINMASKDEYRYELSLNMQLYEEEGKLSSESKALKIAYDILNETNTLIDMKYEDFKKLLEANFIDGDSIVTNVDDNSLYEYSDYLPSINNYITRKFSKVYLKPKYKSIDYKFDDINTKLENYKNDLTKFCEEFAAKIGGYETIEESVDGEIVSLSIEKQDDEYNLVNEYKISTTIALPQRGMNIPFNFEVDIIAANGDKSSPYTSDIEKKEHDEFVEGIVKIVNKYSDIKINLDDIEKYYESEQIREDYELIGCGSGILGDDNHRTNSIYSNVEQRDLYVKFPYTVDGYDKMK